jgi:probable HAF family extracellular repeat protein
VLWDRQRLTPLPAHFSPFDINNAGQIAGTIPGGPVGLRIATVWDRGTFVYLSLRPTDTNSTAYAVNNEGWVAGSAQNVFTLAPERPVVWANGSRVDLQYVGSGGGRALDINAIGQVVGHVRNGSTQVGQAALWAPDQSGQWLGVLLHDYAVGPYSSADAINDRGQAVGWVTSWNAVDRAVLWENGTRIDLVPGAIASAATDINERGQVVGYALVGNRRVPFLWENGTLIELPSHPLAPGATPLRINNRGDIIGTGGVLWTR